jgi:hypothetical protein
MKLYTEEQLKEFFKEHYFFMERDLDNLTPIELPSDEEIEVDPIYYANMTAPYFKDGAKWVINHIKQQDNDTNPK